VENVLMWKPIRCRARLAARFKINADAPHPVGKMDPWRRQVVCVRPRSMRAAAASAFQGQPPLGSILTHLDYYLPGIRLYRRADRIPSKTSWAGMRPATATWRSSSGADADGRL